MTIQAEIKSESEYRELRAICDTANAYWEANATHGRHGSSMSAELAAAPEYAACTNEIRGRVDQYETLRDMPESFVAYLSRDASGRLVASVWTGLPLGYASCLGRTSGRAHTKVFAYRVQMNGREYHGRSQGEGMSIVLRETADSKFRRYVEALKVECARYGFPSCPMTQAQIRMIYKAEYGLQAAYSVACDIAAGFPLSSAMAAVSDELLSNHSNPESI